MTVRPIAAEPWVVRGIAAANEAVRILKADNDAARKHAADCYCHDCCRRANVERVNRAVADIMDKAAADWIEGEERLK